MLYSVPIRDFNCSSSGNYHIFIGYSNHQACQFEKKESGMVCVKDAGITRTLSRTISIKSIQANKNEKNTFSICDIQHQRLLLVFRDITGKHI